MPTQCHRAKAKENKIFPCKMIKLIVKFILGFIVSSIVIFILTYTTGYILEAKGIVLYNSESDQQRNFNIVMSVWLAISIISGYFSTKF